MNGLKTIIGGEVGRSLGEGAYASEFYFDNSHYGTKGMHREFSPGPWRMMGSVEKGSKFRPGIRCKSLSDAWKLYYGLKRIQLNDNVGNISGSYPRWYASGAVSRVCTRRANPDLWLEWNHEIVNEWGYEYKKMTKAPEELVDGESIKKWEDTPPVFKDTYFMYDVTYDGVWDSSVTEIRMFPWWYWETENGVQTGAVYMVIHGSYSARYYKTSAQYYALHIVLGYNKRYFAYEVFPQTYTLQKTACGVTFELYGCYFATNVGNAGMVTPVLAQPVKRWQGVWS